MTRVRLHNFCVRGIRAGTVEFLHGQDVLPQSRSRVANRIRPALTRPCCFRDQGAHELLMTLVWSEKRHILTIFPAQFWASLASAEPLYIASWNIEHLVADTGSGCLPRSEADFQRVRDVIADVDADIWLLQKIEGAAALARVFEDTEWVAHIEERWPRRSYPERRHTPS